MLWPQLSLMLAKLAPLIGVGLLLSVALFGIHVRRRANREGATAWKQAVKAELAEPATLHPEIDPGLCAGCGACVRACPEGDIIKLIDHKAKLVEPTKCVGHGQCEAVCPFDAISLVFGTKTRGMELPRISGNFETNIKGLYIVGELGGMGLIRNAIKQGRMAAEHAVKNLGAGSQADTDVLVVGAGPAGLSASFACIAAKRRFLCIEQNSVGGTVYNFPRQKIVMTQPADLPLIGPMKFPRNKVSKEELLFFWSKARKAARLRVREHTKFLNLRQKGDVFEVETSKGRLTARKVILAMGVRGSPRRLNIPGEDSPKVTYNLLEPEQYKRQHIAVVGGGNAGVEAAQYLANPALRNKVVLLVRGPKFDRCNQENQDIIFDLQKRGRVKIWFDTVVHEVHRKHLVIERHGKRGEIPNNYLFVFAGAELPFKFLQSLGVKIDKKFGEPLKKV